MKQFIPVLTVALFVVTSSAASAAQFDTSLLVKESKAEKQMTVVIEDPDGVIKIKVLGEGIVPLEITNGFPGPSKCEMVVQAKFPGADMMPIEIFVEDSRGFIAKHRFTDYGAFALREAHADRSVNFFLEQKVSRGKASSDVRVLLEDQENLRTVKADLLQLLSPTSVEPVAGGVLVVSGTLGNPEAAGKLLVELGKPGHVWLFEVHVLNRGASTPGR